MKGLRFENVVPVVEFRRKLSSWLSVGALGKPVAVTQHGRVVGVLVPPEMLDELAEEKELLLLALQGVRELQQGELVENEEVWKRVEELLARTEQESHEDT